MNDSYDRTVDAEAGQAGIASDADSITIREMSPTQMSPNTTGFSEKTTGKAEPHQSSWWKRQSAALSILPLYNAGRNIPREERYYATAEVRTLEECPEGYPRLAAFLDSDECFMVYRRFGFIQSRLLLNKQDQLRILEEQLDRLDQREKQANPKYPQTRDLPTDHLKRRQDLFIKLETNFCAYANLMDAAQKMVALKKPTTRDLISVQNFMGKRPLVEEEASWADKEEDLVTLRGGREHAWLDAGIEKILKAFHCRALERLFGDSRTRQKSQGDVKYYARAKIVRLANFIITCMVLVLLVVPIYVLYHLINDVHTERAYTMCMGVLCVSTLAFSAVLSLFTGAKRHEILAAAAAYCAVLVVFVGNIGLGDNK